jgi:hypothetical protein
MRAILIASFAVAVISYCTPPLSAAPAGIAVQQNATPLTHLAQASYWDDYYYGGYRPACPWGYHFYCRTMAYGYRHCACWPDY